MRLDSITDSTDMNLSKLVDGERQRLACSSPWGHKELDATERLSNGDRSNYIGGETSMVERSQG